MKTPEEIKKGLECAMPRSCNGHKCSTCPNATYSLHELLKGDLTKDTFDYITQLEQRLVQAERERDAAVFDLHGHCDYCKTGKNDCAKCVYYHYFHIEEPVEDLWQWRGVCEENSP